MLQNITRVSCHYRIIFSALAALVFLGLLFATNHQAFAAGAVQTSSEHIITLHDDGVDKGFITKKATLREALKEQKIRLDRLDRTEPGLDEKLVASSYQVNVYRARPVVIRDGSSEVKIITSYRTAKQIATQASVVLHDEDTTSLEPSRDPIADGVAEVLSITRATPFNFTFYGKQQQGYTMARTVADMLKEKGISMESVDGISPELSAPIVPNMTIKLWRNGRQTLTQDEDVKFETKQTQDADQPVGYSKVQTPGENGRRTVTYEIDMQNGVEVSRKEINSVTTKQPVQQVEVIGVKNQLPSGSHEDWMAAAGIAANDYGYVNYIVIHEGGWEPCKVQGGAINCSYAGNMGYGVVQATPGGKMVSAGADWRTNPITQLKWASGYAVGRYGSWKGAYEHWLSSHNW